MRKYQKGEWVRLSDDSLAKVMDVNHGQYLIPAGQEIGGGQTPDENGMVMAGEVSYKVKTEDGETKVYGDRYVRNPPKDSGKYTPYVTDEQKAERDERKAANKEREAKAAKKAK